MLQEAMEVFEKLLQSKNGERMVLDAHIPKDGTYRLIEMGDGEWQIRKTLDIYFDKKEKKLIGTMDSDYRFIQELDYYSKLVDMNKPMDPKKVIHSNNYLSIAVKKDSITTGKLTKDIETGYFLILKNPSSKYERKVKAKKLYQSVEERLGTPNLEVLAAIENYVYKHDIWEGIDLEKKDYVKVFFVFPDDEKTRRFYQIESQRYVIPNIYNNNDFNEMDQGEIVGLPNNNMGMNSKKPYLENKTRKIKVPYLLNQDKALLQAKFFDYLMGEVSQKRVNIYIDNDEENPSIHSYTDMEEPNSLDSGYYLRCRKEKNEVEILQADTITGLSTRLRPVFKLKNYMEISEHLLEDSKIKYDKFQYQLWEIKNLMDMVFFEGKLNKNFSTKSGDLSINDGILKRCLLENRDVLADWFWRGNIDRVESNFDKFSFELIKNSIRKRRIINAKHQLNFRWSLLEYLNPERRIGEKMSEVRQKLREHINMSKEQEWDFSSDEEFCYGVGQAVAYLLSLSKANEKTDVVINPYLNARNVNIIRRRLLQMYKKYNYQILHIDGARSAQLLEHLMKYTPQDIKQEHIMAGFLASSLIYEKKEDK